MKVSIRTLTIVLALLLAQVTYSAVYGPELTNSDIIPDDFVPVPPADAPIEQIPAQKRAFTTQTVQSMSDAMAKQAYNLQSGLKIDTYTMATTLFNSQKYFGDMCNRCKKIQYFAFRIGNSYVTAGSFGLTLQVSSSPLNSQLFIGEQQIDGTWAFRSLTQNKYMRAMNDGVTIDWQTYVGPWERWYMERHGNHMHIQSAQFQFYYWTAGFGVLRQMNSGASSFIVQHWSKINWLWNW